MKKLFILFSLILVSIAFADTWVNGYTRKDGTYVPGHYRSSPDGDASNNWSTKGNTNPYTGERGTRTYGGAYDENGATGRQGTCQTVYIPGGYDAEGNYRSGRYVSKCD